MYIIISEICIYEIPDTAEPKTLLFISLNYVFIITEA
jgi:hypothetical protein